VDQELKVRLDSNAKVLQAIHEEVLKALGKEASVDIRECLERIESMCRYSYDIRTESERTT